MFVETVIATLDESAAAPNRLRADREAHAAIARAGKLLADCLQGGGRVFACGNGGSMCDAMHFAEELSGRYRKDRRALVGQAISDAGHLSCVGNDYGYEQAFARYVDAHSRAGDTLVAISTSGSSANVCRAAEVAIAQGVTVIALTGLAGSALGSVVTIEVCTPRVSTWIASKSCT